MRNYDITISIESDENDWNLEKDVQAAVSLLEDRGINVTSWDLQDADEENEDD